MSQDLALNHNSNSLQKLLPGNVPERASTADIGRLIARCLANYGERRGIDMRLVTAEWHATLGAYPANRLNDALSEHIRKSTFWPTIANLVDLLRAETPAPLMPRVKAEPKVDLAPAEISHRAAVIAEAKRKYGYSPALDAWDDNNKPQKADTGPFVVEVSDVSDALRAVLAKQRNRSIPQ